MKVAHSSVNRRKRAELYPFGKGPGDQRRRNHCEHHLEEHEGLVRYGRRIIGIGLHSQPR